MSDSDFFIPPQLASRLRSLSTFATGSGWVDTCPSVTRLSLSPASACMQPFQLASRLTGLLSPVSQPAFIILNCGLRLNTARPTNSFQHWKSVACKYCCWIDSASSWFDTFPKTKKHIEKPHVTIRARRISALYFIASTVKYVSGRLVESHGDDILPKCNFPGLSTGRAWLQFWGFNTFAWNSKWKQVCVKDPLCKAVPFEPIVNTGGVMRGSTLAFISANLPELHATSVVVRC